jgi:hypothetical protein
MVDPYSEFEDTPEVLARDKQVLDYRPDLVRDVPPATSTTRVTSTQVQVVPVATAQTQEHIVAVLATYHDVLAVSKWLTAAQSAMELALAEVTVPVKSDALTAAQIAVLTAQLGRDFVTFADVQNALANQKLQSSKIVLTAWERAMFGMDGRLDGIFYSDIYHYNNTIHPIILDNTINLLAVSSFAILGQTGNDTNGQLDLLATGAGDNSLTFDQNSLASYAKMQDTLAGMNSDITYTVGQIQYAIASNAPVGGASEELVLALSQAVNLGGNVSGVGIELSKLLGVINSLTVLFELVSSNDWFSMDGLKQQLDQIIENLIFSIVGQTASMIMHLQGQLVAPLLEVIQTIDGIYGGFGGKAPAVIDKFGNTLATIAEKTVGKFEQRLLDFYRHSALHNALVSKKVSTATQNNHMRNMVATLQKYAKYIQGATNAVNQVQNVASQVGASMTALTGGLAQLPALPALAVQKPATTATVSQIIGSSSSKWGVVSAGTPGQTASNLLNNIRSL